MRFGRVAIGVLAFSACARPAAPASVASAPGAASVALIEWQFPTSPSLSVHPLQQRVAEDASLAPALYPNLSEANATESEWGLSRLVEHAERVHHAFVAGRDGIDPPFLLNISTRTPDAVRAVVAHGARVVSSSAGSTDTLTGLEAVVAEHPDVLFVAATPHISGNSIPVEAIGELPSILAVRGVPNVILAGCVEFYGDGVDAARAGQPLGTEQNPLHVDNQPAGDARQVFLLSCRSTRAFAEGLGGTSAAAPHLASLLALIVGARTARGLPTSTDDAWADLDRVTHRGLAREKTGEVREVSFFTLDTVLLAAGRPLVTESIWGEVADHPDPLPLPR